MKITKISKENFEGDVCHLSCESGAQNVYVNGIGVSLPDDSNKPKPCTHCYKSNTAVGKNMSLETFKGIYATLPKTVTQIAVIETDEGTYEVRQDAQVLLRDGRTILAKDLQENDDIEKIRNN